MQKFLGIASTRFWTVTKIQTVLNMNDHAFYNILENFLTLYVLIDWDTCKRSVVVCHMKVTLDALKTFFCKKKRSTSDFWKTATFRLTAHLGFEHSKKSWTFFVHSTSILLAHQAFRILDPCDQSLLLVHRIFGKISRREHDAVQRSFKAVVKNSILTASLIRKRIFRFKPTSFGTVLQY